MAKVYREKFRAYGMRTGMEHVEIMRFLTVAMVLVFVGMLFTLATFLIKG